MKKKLSIHDLAKQLGVSATAISFVINGKAEEKGISESLRKKIVDYIDEIGYKPNIVAQSLRTGKTKIIGMLVEDISDDFFSQIARGVEACLSNFGYKLFIVSTENDTSKTKGLLKVFRERQVDGYIIAPPIGVEKDLNELMDDGKPLILFDRYFPLVNTNNVIINNCEAVEQALMHLRKNGFTQAGFVTLASSQNQIKERCHGYEKVVERFGQEKFILEVPYHCPAKTVVRKVKAFLNQHKHLDSLLFATNYLTVSGLEAIKEVGLNVPANLAVVSFDDNKHFRILSPTITAVAQPLEQIAETVVVMLMKNLNKDSQSEMNETVILQAELIIRASSGLNIEAPFTDHG
jgi:LacI family transcriptional regulator